MHGILISLHWISGGVSHVVDNVTLPDCCALYLSIKRNADSVVWELTWRQAANDQRKRDELRNIVINSNK